MLQPKDLQRPLLLHEMKRHAIAGSTLLFFHPIPTTLHAEIDLHGVEQQTNRFDPF